MYFLNGIENQKMNFSLRNRKSINLGNETVYLMLKRNYRYFPKSEANERYSVTHSQFD